MASTEGTGSPLRRAVMPSALSRSKYREILSRNTSDFRHLPLRTSRGGGLTVALFASPTSFAEARNHCQGQWACRTEPAAGRAPCAALRRGPLIGSRASGGIWINLVHDCLCLGEKKLEVGLHDRDYTGASRRCATRAQLLFGNSRTLSAI